MCGDFFGGKVRWLWYVGRGRRYLLAKLVAFRTQSGDEETTQRTVDLKASDAAT